MLLQQTWALTKKDLTIILRRRWLSTFIRALAFPIIFTVIVAHIKIWVQQPGSYGVGTPAPIRSLPDALAAGSSTRPRFVIVDNGFKDGDIGSVVRNISSIVSASGKDLVTTSNVGDLTRLCQSTTGGVSSCFAAVEFKSSPTNPGFNGSRNWNYTIYNDNSLSTTDINTQNNGAQIYTLPLQRAVDSVIASNKGRVLPELLQYPYTMETDAQRQITENQQFQSIVFIAFGVVLFIALSTSIYHLVSHVVGQREQNMTQLIDAMMPKKSPWEAIIARTLATHITFDLVYLPSWIIMGAAMPVTLFPHTNPGWFVLLYVLTGLALNSYSILASSLFRRVQLSASCAIIAAFVFAIAAELGISDNGQPFASSTSLNGAVYALSILFPPSAYCFFIMQTAGYEYDQQGLQIGTSTNFISYWNVPAGSILACLLFSLFLYPVLAAVIEHYLWGTNSKSRVVMGGDSMSGVAVRIRNFSKTFKSRIDKKQTVSAVSDLSLDVYAGSITVLLGANGSGKSTTLNTIAGLETITNGSIEIDGTGGLGLCPQANIIYPYLSVWEHVDFFESLKNTTSRSRAERKAEVDRIIVGCDLANKRDAIAKTLSGGQKRKLQLAMMLAGGSRVCCIDEASSGIDPISRRKVWDILRAERGKRSLLFTTHFLDEAEGLSDHVAILSKGSLKAQGSVAALKAEHGGGYQVVLMDSAREAKIVLPDGVKAEKDYNRTVYKMPNSAILADFVAKLDQQDIHSYRVEGPTVEKVFLALSDEVQGDSDLARELRMADSESADDAATLNGKSASVSVPGKSGSRALNLTSGKTLGPVQQTLVIFRKRLIILKHDYMPYLAAVFVSLVVAGCCTLLLPLKPRDPLHNGVPCQDPNNQQRGPYSYGATKNSFTSGFVYGPPDRLNANQFIAALPDRPAEGGISYGVSAGYYNGSRYNVSTAGTVSSLSGFHDYVSNNTRTLYQGGLYNDTTGVQIAWEQSRSAAQLQAIVDGIAINETIAFSTGGFLPAFSPSGSFGPFFTIITAIGYSLYPGFMALYVTSERLRNVRQMHFSNGILSSSLWAGHALFDLMWVLLISILTVAIWAGTWHGWYGLGYLFVVIFLYGITAVAFSYIVSLFVRSQSAAYGAAAVIQAIIALLYFLGYILSASQAQPDQIYSWFNYIHYTIALICPVVSLERALLMSVNAYSLSCHGTSYASYPGETGIYGAPILYLIIQFIVFSMFLMYWEGGRSFEVFGLRSKQKKQTQPIDLEKLAAVRTQNPDAIESEERLEPANSGLRVENVSKTFGSTLAVDHATFGILPSEKFALLGPNGAGKSTMISLLRRELKPDRDRDGSAIHIGGDDLRTAPQAARSHLGVCPQFDSIDSMTLIEHLRFYARARGVPDREANINELINRLGLTEHKNKLAKKLSGGTKRKLSLAIALVANPSVLLLDEPSSGMDPAAKRALWSTLSAIAEGRVLLMTTHSMEEADALCDRAGIMSGRMLALGTMEDLRRQHGNAAFIHLVHKDAPYTTTEQMEAMNAWVDGTFPNAIVEQRNFGGQMRFSVPQAKLHNSDLETGKLFRLIEHVKEEIGVVDYSIGPATLDQVFLNVVEKHNVQEENSKVEVKTGFMGLRKRIARK